MNDLQRIKKVVKWLIFSDYGCLLYTSDAADE